MRGDGPNDIRIRELVRRIKSEGITEVVLALNTDIESLERHVKNLDDKIRTDIAELASLKAWGFCFKRMKDDHRRHLMAWQNSMKKLQN